MGTQQGHGVAWSRRRWMAAVAATLGGSLATAPEARAAEHAWLGVATDQVGRRVMIRRVITHSPAGRAGISAGDQLLSLDGEPVMSRAQVIATTARKGPGATLEMVVGRGRRRLHLRAILAPKPSPEELTRLDLQGTFAPPFRDHAVVQGRFPGVSALRGRVLLIDFWASWCVPCRLVAPQLEALATRYEARGLVVVGVTTDAPERALETARNWGIGYPVVSDPEETVSRAYRAFAIPSLVLVGKSGRIGEVIVGYDSSTLRRIEGAVSAHLDPSSKR